MADTGSNENFEARMPPSRATCSAQHAKMEQLGYYFDLEKKRYFKIEKGKNAPGSVWTLDKVKKRKLEDEQAASALRRLNLNKGRIKRARALNDTIAGGFFAREYGIKNDDLPVAGYASGLVDKGSISLVNELGPTDCHHINAMCISPGDEWSGLGVGFVSLNWSQLLSTYIPRDKNGRIQRSLLANYRTPFHQMGPWVEFGCRQISDMKFDHRRNAILLTQREPSRNAAVVMHRIQGADTYGDTKMPRLQLGVRSKTSRAMAPMFVEDLSRAGEYQSNCLAVGPDWASNILCAVGTNRGIMQHKGNRLEWLAPHINSSKKSRKDNGFRDIFSVAYLKSHDQVILAGGRPGRCFLADTRAIDKTWLSFQHASTITHTKPLDDKYVLVSGVRDKMCIYDIRSVKKGTFPRPKPESPRFVDWSEHARAVVSFPEYKNKAHIDHGLDVDVDTGLVAAAHDNGDVALFSTKTGHRLKSPGVGDFSRQAGEHIKALQFQRLPGDTTPSLFAGVGEKIHMRSFGAGSLKEEA
ncbi:hypothetical protein JX266_009632 [Neoarthrinium moseri]|nr:hypothetical protein JX266_009632 [Neoarthrinium moseri]